MIKKIIYIVNGSQKYSSIIRKDWLEAYNNEPFDEKWVVSLDELNEEKISEINNNCAAILIRETQFDLNSNNLLNKFKIPILSQIEFPYLYLDAIQKNRIYLTDESYLNYFPKSEIQFDFLKKTNPQFDLQKKKYDVLFIGTLGLRQPIQNNSIIEKAIREKWMDTYINDFSSTDNVFSKLISEKFRYRIFKFFNSNKKIKEVEWFLQHQIRIQRRNFILDQLLKLAKLGHKIAFVTNENSKKLLSEEVISNFQIFYDLDFHTQLPELAEKSNLVICTTPLHHSLINERFMLAIESGAIPMVEPYPQYQPIYNNLDELIFNYEEDNLINQITLILSDKTKLENKFRLLHKKSGKLLDRDNFKEYLDKIINKSYL